MKNILVTTDFSETANNATDYAYQLAQQTGGTITLFHVYHIPIPTGEMQFIALTADDLEKNAMDELQKLSNKYKSSGIKTEIAYTPGFASEEIIHKAKTGNYDLVVCGIKGSSKISDLIIGSTATSLLNDYKGQVIIIPSTSKFKSIKKIAFACDYKSISPKIISAIRNLVSTFKANLSVIDVVNPAKIPALEEAIAGVKLENSLDGLAHELYFPQNENIVDGLNNFIDAHEPDLMVMVPHHHNLIDRILQKSNTKRIVFNSHIPVLCMHE